MYRGLLLALAGLISASAADASSGSPPSVTIATGPIAGFAYPLGGELCHLFEKAGAPARYGCLVAPTEGSIDDLKRLRDGEVTFAIVQSDVALQAVSASGPFTGATPFTDLRSIAGFYSDALTILVRSDGPAQIDQIKGKRIAVGEPGMPEPLFGELLDGLGWTKADLGGIVEMPRDKQISALCDGKIAAIALSAPHPNGFVRQALGVCPLFELDLQGPALVSVLAGHPAYAPATIDLGVYTGASRPMQSFGPRAVLVTTAAADEQTITRMLSAVFRHTEELKKAHPAFGGLTAAQIGSDVGLGAPRHPIVAKYLSENATSGPPGGQ